VSQVRVDKQLIAMSIITILLAFSKSKINSISIDISSKNLNQKINNRKSLLTLDSHDSSESEPNFNPELLRIDISLGETNLDARDKVMLIE